MASVFCARWAGSVAFSLLVAGCGAPPTSKPAGAAKSRTSERPTDGDQSSEGRSSSKSVQNLPDFQLETLDGDTVALSDHLGKDVILIDFWATFCDPCLVAMPHLNALYEKYERRE
jgi:thiol-disulfide isomerase/thioredoxin